MSVPACLIGLWFAVQILRGIDDYDENKIDMYQKVNKQEPVYYTGSCIQCIGCEGPMWANTGTRVPIKVNWRQLGTLMVI